MWPFPNLIRLLLKRSLRVLGISADLRRLPPEIGYLFRLTHLLLGQHGSTRGIMEAIDGWGYSPNSFSVLPKEIRHLSNLQVLDLQGSKLAIPPEILKRTDEPQAVLNYVTAHTTCAECRKGSTGVPSEAINL
jgi:hypothetical protein